MAFRKGSCEATGLLKTLSTTDIPIICEISCIASSVKSALGSKWRDFSLQNGDVLPRFCVPPTHSVSAHFTFCFGLEHQKAHFKDIRSCFQQLLVKLFTHFPSPADVLWDKAWIFSYCHSFITQKFIFKCSTDHHFLLKEVMFTCTICIQNTQSYKGRGIYSHTSLLPPDPC